MDKITFKLELSAREIVEVSVALGQAIAVLEDACSEDRYVFSTSQNTLRNLLTILHDQSEPNEHREGLPMNPRAKFGNGNQRLF